MLCKSQKVEAIKVRLRAEFPGPFVVFDLEEQRRLQALIEKCGLSPAEAQALREDLATLVVNLPCEVPALLSELEQLAP